MEGKREGERLVRWRRRMRVCGEREGEGVR